jgi:hypothetical protein
MIIKCERSGHSSMDVLCSFCRTVIHVQSCNDVLEFEKFIGGKFKTPTLRYMLSKRFHDVKLLVAGMRPRASHYLFLVLVVCATLGKTLLLITLVRSVALNKSRLHLWSFFVSMLCSLGLDTFIDYLIAFPGLWPGIMLCKTLLIYLYHGFNAD